MVVVLVLKRNGEFCFVMDYWKLNKVMKFVFFLFMRLEDVVDVIGEVNVKIFFVFDFVGGFW